MADKMDMSLDDIIACKLIYFLLILPLKHLSRKVLKLLYKPTIIYQSFGYASIIMRIRILVSAFFIWIRIRGKGDPKMKFYLNFKTIFVILLGGVGDYFIQCLRSRHYSGQLRLRKSEVLEPTPAPTKLGRLRLQAKKGGSGSIH